VAVDVHEGDVRIARYRLGVASIRAYDADALQLGRVRVAPDGFSVRGRDGTEVGRIENDEACLTVEIGSLACETTCAPDACTVSCSDARTMTVPVVEPGVVDDGSRHWQWDAHPGAIALSAGDTTRIVPLFRWSRPAIAVLAAAPAWGVDEVPDGLVTAAIAFGVEQCAASLAEVSATEPGGGPRTPRE
jgi:hypothetical protein